VRTAHGCIADEPFDPRPATWATQGAAVTHRERATGQGVCRRIRRADRDPRSPPYPHGRREDRQRPLADLARGRRSRGFDRDRP